MPKKKQPRPTRWPERETPRMAIRADGDDRTAVFFRPRHKSDGAPWEDDRTGQRFSYADVDEKPRRATR